MVSYQSHRNVTEAHNPIKVTTLKSTNGELHSHTGPVLSLFFLFYCFGDWQDPHTRAANDLAYICTFLKFEFLLTVYLQSLL